MRILLTVVLFIVAGLSIATYFVTLPKPPALPQAPISEEVLQQLPQDRKGQVLIYGAYGFSGSGISRLAAQYGITPVLAGRNEKKLKPLAQSLGYDHVVLSLNNHDNMVAVLRHFEVVLHIAGPYTYTSKPMLDAAIAAGTHYLDLTGENHVIQADLDRDEEFKEANIMVMPAVGFDVAPTDCLNVYVANQIDNPTTLTVLLHNNFNAVEGIGSSRGTAKSALEVLSRPLLMRQNGEMVEVAAPKVMTRIFEEREQTLVQIPWADMMTSFVSTGIPTIEVYSVQEGEVPSWLLSMARFEIGRNILSYLIDNFLPEGPPPNVQKDRQNRIESIVSNDAGDTASATLITPEAYLLTFHSTLIVARRILDGHWESGFQTVGKVYGPDLILEVPGVTRIAPQN
ncbi:MAG: hypothetical protein HOC23_23395 [Halieaceae bacterium]|jgi:short subunit dehydrogenase-like uncharacterized protein|nr:hypothetical protein [Halieaceae bacterium]